jgi:hypothetical protein
MLFTRLELVLDDLRMATSVVVLGEICAGLGRPARRMLNEFCRKASAELVTLCTRSIGAARTTLNNYLDAAPNDE